MADPYRKVRPGEPMKIQATTWNTVVDAAREYKLSEQDRLAGELNTPRNGDIIKVRNDSGTALRRRDVLGLDRPIFDPNDSEKAENTFLSEVMFVGVRPEAEHSGRFAVMIDPTDVGRIGRAFVSGVTQVRLYVMDPDHTCADVVPGDVTALMTTETGSAQILWPLGGNPYGGYDYDFIEGPTWAVIRFGTTCGGTSSTGPGGGGFDARCDCPGDPEDYIVEVDCGYCGPYYGFTHMPRFWFIEITAAETTIYGEGYGPGYCDTIACEALAGARIRIENEPIPYDAYGSASCTWSGVGSNCIEAELTLEGDDWKLSIFDREGCLLAVLRKPAGEFACCGPNSGWATDPYSECDFDLILTPDPCACCGGTIECPPDGRPVCSSTDCCLESCACTLVVTVNNLASPPGLPCTADVDCYTSEGEPCNFGDPDCWIIPPGQPPDEQCGGMNGVYAMQWVGDCTWRFKGVPGGTGSVTVEAQMTLEGRLWRLRLEGPDGQLAVFELEDWDCGQSIVFEFQEGKSTCPILGPAPVADMTLCLNVN